MSTRQPDDNYSFAGGLDLEPRTNAGGAALALLTSDSCVLFSSINTGAIVISETLADGQICALHMTAFDTDDYTMVVEGGTLTFNAADESALVQHDGTTVRVLSLNGATVV